MESQWTHPDTLGGTTHLFGGLIEKLVSQKARLFIPHLNVGAGEMSERCQQRLKEVEKLMEEALRRTPSAPTAQSRQKPVVPSHTHSLNHKECVFRCVLVPQSRWSTSSKFSIPRWSISWSESADTASRASINSSALSATYSGSAPPQSTLPARSNTSLTN